MHRLDNRRGLPLVLLLLECALSSCGGQSAAPAIVFDPAYMNKQVELVAPPYFNTFDTEDSVALEVRYKSENSITFPSNYGARIFSLQKDGWVEIGETTTERYPSGENRFTPESGPAVQVAIFFPELPDPQRSYLLRIYVIGTMEVGNVAHPVAAYVDFRMHP